MKPGTYFVLSIVAALGTSLVGVALGSQLLQGVAIAAGFWLGCLAYDADLEAAMEAAA